MFTHTEKIRVRYGETDKMGYVYHGNYALYYEISRVELLRKLGIDYSKLEKEGIGLPVLDYNIKFIRPAYYDEIISVVVSVTQKPKVKITFNYECLNSENLLINTGNVTLVFIKLNNGKPIKCPDKISYLFENYIE
ncbi:MAG: acyl-CoA thioesterase [Bacteroidia bacterium]|nr:acyl-CoA thioesterase [Bacteroidia bacterium]